MAEVKLFGGLRRFAAAQPIKVRAGTIRSMLEMLRAENPALVDAILDGAALRPYVRVTINGHDVALREGLDTPLADGDSVAIFPPIGGG